MSKVEIEELITGDTADAANANSTLTSWNSASSDVDGQNVRDEGIDLRTLKNEFQVFGDMISTAQVTDPFFTVTTPGYAHITPSFQIGGFDFDPATDGLIVRCSMQFEYTVNAPVLNIRLTRRHTSAGALVGLPTTEREFQLGTTGTIMRSVYTVTHHYTGVANSDVWFTAQAKVSTDTATLTHGFLTAILYRKV